MPAEEPQPAPSPVAPEAAAVPPVAPPPGRRLPWQSLENLREQQVSAMAYFDAFLIFAAVGGLLAFLVLFMRRSVVEKGTHIAAE